MSRPTRRRTKSNRPEPRPVNVGGHYCLYPPETKRSSNVRQTTKELT
jgi:hypothetical protein